jgi:phosphoserine phosphatase
MGGDSRNRAPAFRRDESMASEMSGELLDTDKLQQQLGGSMKLVEVTCQLAAQQDLEQILQTVTTSVCEALNCERASLYLYDEHKQELYTRAVTELEIAEIRTSVEGGITGWVARRRKIANIPDPHLDARWNSAIDRQTGFQTRNILAAPVISQHDGRLLGVLQLLNKLDGKFDDFDEQLIQAFASHAATALERALLVDEARRSQEIQVSLEMARNIQSGFLPAKLPHIPGYEVAAWWQPAEAVGGDYYDLLQLPDGKLGLAVADVSGHGVAASLIMASVRAMLHVLTRTLSDPDEIISLLSETIDPDLHDERFITFLMVALDPHKHEARFANAGHGPALHFHRRTQTFHKLRSTALPMGFLTDFRVPGGQPLQLEPGDLLLLATDGAVELRDGHNEIFGNERLQHIVREHCRLPAPALVDVIRKAITSFHTEAHPPDDITLLLVERKMG